MSPKPKPRSKGGSFRVARSGDTVYVCVSGLGTMTNSMTLSGFANAMTQEGYGRFVIDLERCRGVDSTFMGVLVGLNERAGGVVIVNAGPHCLKQLASVGLDRILKIDARPQALPDGVALTKLPEAAESPMERLRLIAKAHKELIRVDRRNEAKFGAFLQGIVRELGEV